MNIKKYEKPMFISFFALLAILPFFFCLHGHLAVDESYYMFMGNNVLHGSIPYKDYVDVAPPALYYLHALTFLAFGKSLYAARVILYIFNTLSAVVLFLIGRKLWNEKVGMLSSILLLFGINGPCYEGNLVLGDAFMLFFGLLGLLLFFKSKHWTYLMSSGILMGVSTTFKQFGGLFLLTIFVFYILRLWVPDNRTKDYLEGCIKQILLISSGFLILIAIVILYFWSVDALDDLIYWAFLFPLKFFHHSLESLSDIATVRVILTMRFLPYSIVWFFSLVSILTIGYGFIKKQAKDDDIFSVVWLLISLYPLSMELNSRYYIPLLPPACLLASVTLIKIFPMLSPRSIKDALSNVDHSRIVAITCVLLLILSSIGTSGICEYTFQKGSLQSLSDQIQTADYVRSHTLPDEKILSLDFEPTIYFLSDRNPPTEFLWLGELFVDEEEQYHIIEQIKESNVRYVTVCRYQIVEGKSIAQHIYEFIVENYTIEKSIGIFDIYRKR